MKALFVICLMANVLFVDAQSYVDSGIRHYIAEEYEEALVDFDEAVSLKSLFTEFAVSKLHFYRGMSLYQIHEGKTTLDLEMIEEIYGDLYVALDIDSSWMETADDVLEAIYIETLEIAGGELKTARKEKEIEARVNQTNGYIDILQTGFKIKKVAEVELLIAQAYHEIGDLYFEDSNNVASLQKAGANFGKAIEYYEMARYDDPFSKGIIKSLLTLSKRMDDPQRVEEYSKLLALAGG